MNKTKIVCIGKIKEQYLKDAINEYFKRISKFTKLEIIEIKDFPIPKKEGEVNITKIKELESNLLFEKIKSDEFVVALDLKGEMVSSEEFSAIIEEKINKSIKITFLIGGSLGFSNKLLSKSNLVISFSKLTFPHQLIRLFLLEQIYRSFKIIRGEKYHK